MAHASRWHARGRPNVMQRTIWLFVGGAAALVRAEANGDLLIELAAATRLVAAPKLTFPLIHLRQKGCHFPRQFEG
jgi:hypothetical protein